MTAPVVTPTTPGAQVVNLQSFAPWIGFCDPARSTGTKSYRTCDSAIVICGQDALGRVCVPVVWLDRGSTDRLIDMVFYLQETWQCQLFGFEKTGLPAMFLDAIQREARWAQRYLPLVPVDQPRSLDKLLRIQLRVAPLWTANRLYFVPGDGTMQLVRQILEFPSGSRIDALDALSSALSLLAAPDHRKRLRGPLALGSEASGPE
jgi:hypothetical protein